MNIKLIFMYTISLFTVLVLGLAACTPTDNVVQTAVAGTLAAVPSATMPAPAKLPTLDQASIANILLSNTPVPPPAEEQDGTATPVGTAANPVPYMYLFHSTLIPIQGTPGTTSISDITDFTYYWNGQPVPYPVNVLTLGTPDCNQPINVNSISVEVTTDIGMSFNYMWILMILSKDSNGNMNQQNLILGPETPITFTSAGSQVIPQMIPQNIPFNNIGCGSYTVALAVYGFSDGGGGYLMEGLNIQANASVTITPITGPGTPSPTLLRLLHIPSLLPIKPTLIRIPILPTYTPTPTKVIRILPTVPVIKPTIPRIIIIPTATPVPPPPIILPTVIRILPTVPIIHRLP
jgi:hypothetical protein